MVIPHWLSGIQYAGRGEPATTGKANPWIASTLGEAVIGASRTKTFLGSRYHRLARLRRKRQLIAELERLSGKKVLRQQEAAA